jgi:acetyl esterase/lipase
LTKDAIPKAAMIFVHGGGYVFGDLDSYDPFLINFVKELNMIIISIE